MSADNPLNVAAELATCRHCGETGAAGEDHSCPCPNRDEDCAEHTGPTETCRVYEVDGNPVRVRGSEPLGAEGEAALAVLVRAVQGMHTEAEWDEIGRKQAAALERIHARNRRLLGGDSGE